MNNIFGLNYYVFCILVLVVVLYFTKNVRDEGFFGMSPGTMDQLSSTHVPNTNDQVEAAIQAKLIEKGITQMTESGYGDREQFQDENTDRILKELYSSINSKK